MKQIYLDYAAATPLDARVLRAMQPYFSEQFYNPSATYLAGRGARQALNAKRAVIAGILGARPAEIVFTAGATEANNLAIQGVMKQYPKAEVLVSALEHESVLAAAREYTSRTIPVDKQGIIDLAAMQKMISDKTVLISTMYVNNEIGSIQPLRAVRKIIDEVIRLRKHKNNHLPLLLHSDAAQAPLYLDLHAARLGVDLLSINGGKIYGPKQSGALYLKAGIKLQPIILGGGQEFGLRSGTENLAAAAGLATALELGQQNRQNESIRVKKLRTDFIALAQAKIPSIIINGSLKHFAPHIISATFAGADNERLMMQLDELGIQVATGSACSASSEEPSHVLGAIGLNAAAARSTLRLSLGKDTNLKDLQNAVAVLSGLVAPQQ